ncbi:MAG: hypothetical protein NC925_02785 [Candidatus Omnitrophica bacterium]|nr:hypothetical protein [Candidatus Omnitrophota bacterium]
MTLSKYIHISKYLILLSITCIYVSFILIFAKINFENNISGFFYIGQKYKWQPLLPNGAFIHKNDGYDGQFYLYIAQDPFILKGPEEKYQYIDSPAYRYQRIVFPLISFILSRGDKEKIPYIFILINLSSLIAGSWIIILMCKLENKPLSYSFFYAFSTGFLISIMRNLVEPLASFFAICGIYFYFRKKFEKMSLAFTFSVLTKETFALMPLGIMIQIFFETFLSLIKINKVPDDKKLISKKIFFSIIPILSFFIWQLYIFKQFGKFSYQEGMGNMGFPFYGIIEKTYSLYLNSLISYRSLFEMLSFSSILLIFIFLIYNIFAKKNPLLGIGLVYIVFISLYSKDIWCEFYSFSRVANELFIIAILYLINIKKKFLKVPLIFNSIIFFIALLGFLGKANIFIRFL